MRSAFKMLRILLSLVVLGGAATASHAQDYPHQTIRLIVGYQAGGPTDMTARLIAAKLQQSMGQPVIVENKPGAGSNMASEYVAQAKPDGYTLLLAAAPMSWNPVLYKSAKFDALKSFVPVVNVMTSPQVLAFSKHFKAKDLADMVTQARQQPGKFAFGSSGNGGSAHLAAELLKQRAKIDLLHIPYKGASGLLNDLIAGHVDMAFLTAMSAIPNLRNGDPRPIAVASEKRLPQLPDVPTLAELGYPGFQSESWNGLFAPAHTPPEIVARLNAEVNKALQERNVREKLAEQGAMVVGGSSQEFHKYLTEEVARWGGLLKTLNISL